VAATLSGQDHEPESKLGIWPEWRNAESIATKVSGGIRISFGIETT